MISTLAIVRRWAFAATWPSILEAGVAGDMGTLMRWVLLLTLVSMGVLVPNIGAAQVGSGATLTVLRGSVAVLHADGTPLAQGTSGTALGVGDQISTLDGSGAIITFFEGSEVELGSNTTIVINEASRQGSRTTITLANVVGATVHRVVTLSDPGSSYRVESGGTVGLVRGTVFGHYVDPNGTIVVALQRCDALPGASERARTQCLEFPFEGLRVNVGTKVTYTPRGNTIVEGIRLNDSLFNVITELPTDEDGTKNPGFNTGSRTVSQHTSSRVSEKDQDPAGTPTPDPCGVATPGRTQLIAPAAPGARELQVCPPVGFAVGNTVRINPGGSPSETGVISGFASILLRDPIAFGYGTGTIVVLEQGTPTSTPSPAPTGTPTPTSTVTASPTSSPTGTVLVSPTATNTPTSTSSPTPTSTSSPTPTSTATGTPTSTPAVVVAISSVGTPNPIVEPRGGTVTTMTFPVSLSRTFDQDVSVTYGATPVTATVGAPCGAAEPTFDFAPAVGTVTIPANLDPPTQNINVTICGNYLSVIDDLLETFEVAISGPTSGAILGNALSTGTIRDRPRLSIDNPAAVVEGDSGTRTVTFNVTMSPDAIQVVTVDYATADNTATVANNDYVARTGTLTFNPGETLQTIDITINGDFFAEVNETFFVQLTNASNASIEDGEGFATINNDDIIIARG